MLYIFGYGSLISAYGINGRNLSHHYYDHELIETSLSEYHRQWNVTLGSNTFLGISPSLSNSVNGVIFQLPKHDLFPFKLSENIHNKPTDSYTLVDVTNLITIIDSNNTLHSLSLDDQVLTCVTLNPTLNNIPPKNNYYTKIIKTCLKSRSKKFIKEFLQNTPL